jgi:hypothetical protein
VNFSDIKTGFVVSRWLLCVEISLSRKHKLTEIELHSFIRPFVFFLFFVVKSVASLQPLRGERSIHTETTSVFVISVFLVSNTNQSDRILQESSRGRTEARHTIPSYFGFELGLKDRSRIDLGIPPVQIRVIVFFEPIPFSYSP